MTPLRVLIAAEHASTRLGGEAILPFHYFRLLRARQIDAHLIVHERTRPELLTLFPQEQDRIHFIPDQLLQKLFFRLGRPFPRRLAEATFGLANQLLTQRAQRPVLRALASASSVIHQPIPVSPRFPSLLHDLGSPLVVGPLNGGMDYPPAFRRSESLLSRLAIALGRSFANLGNTLLPGKRRAALVLVANPRTRAALPSGITGRIVQLPENAVDLTHFPSPPRPPPPTTPNFVFLGRLVDWKALDIVLEALTRVPNASLDVIGEGPMRPAWQSLAASLNLTQRIHFHGYLPQQQAAELLARASALVLPSLYESGGAVVLEAMALARPVVAAAWGGPTDYLDPTCGILVPPTSRPALIEGFARAMTRLASDPGHAAQLGAAGRTRLLAHFDWQHKIDTILTLYQQALEL